MKFRFVITSLICGTALLAAPGPASAQPAVPKGDSFLFLEAAAGEVCPFAVRVDATANQLVRTTLPDGVLVITGPGYATAVNLDTGTSAIYNISGPGTFDPATNRLSLFGKSLIVQFSNVGTPFLITTSGKVGFIVNQPIDQPLRGHISNNICAELT